MPRPNSGKRLASSSDRDETGSGTEMVEKGIRGCISERETRAKFKTARMRGGLEATSPDGNVFDSRGDSQENLHHQLSTMETRIVFRER